MNQKLLPINAVAACVISVALTGCIHKADKNSSAESPSIEVATPFDETRVPPMLSGKIDAAFAARTIPASAKPTYARTFVQGYHHAIASPSSEISMGGAKDDPAACGFGDGVVQGKKDSPLPREQFIEIFRAAGYTQQNLIGVYTAGFEQLDFVPDGQQTRWWLQNTPYASAQQGHLALTALVSPKGTYGHFGSYERQVLVLESQPQR